MHIVMTNVRAFVVEAKCCAKEIIYCYGQQLIEGLLLEGMMVRPEVAYDVNAYHWLCVLFFYDDVLQAKKGGWKKIRADTKELPDVVKNMVCCLFSKFEGMAPDTRCWCIGATACLLPTLGGMIALHFMVFAEKPLLM